MAYTAARGRESRIRTPGLGAAAGARAATHGPRRTACARRHRRGATLGPHSSLW